MGRHTIEKHPGYKRHMRRRRFMFAVYDTTQILVGFSIGVVVTSLLVILLEGGL